MALRLAGMMVALKVVLMVYMMAVMKVVLLAA